MLDYSHRHVFENSFYCVNILYTIPVSKSRDVCLFFDSKRREPSQQTQLPSSSFYTSVIP